MSLKSLSPEHMHAVRRAALAALFSSHLTAEYPPDAASYIAKTEGFTDSMEESLLSYVEQANDVERLERLFAVHLSHAWPLERLAVIDRMILRLATMEIYQFDHIPPKVTISESLKLAEEFGDKNSVKFIHGVLGSVLKNSPKNNWVAPKHVPDLAPQAEEEMAEQPEEDIVLSDSPWRIKSEDPEAEIEGTEDKD